MKWNHPAYKVLGLSKTETAIMGALSEPKSVQQIAVSSARSRTGINHALKNLIARDLVVEKAKGKRLLYQSLSPAALYDKIRPAMIELEKDLPEKRGLRIRERMSEFAIHIGTKEIIPAYKRIAYENKNERIFAIQHHRSWKELLKKISTAQLAAFNRAIKKNKLILEGMLNESAYASYTEELKTAPAQNKEAIESLEGRMADYAVFPDDFFDFDAELWLFKNTALIINWHEEFAVEITNQNITGFLKDMFTLVKRTARKLDHQKALEQATKSP